MGLARVDVMKVAPTVVNVVPRLMEQTGVDTWQRATAAARRTYVCVGGSQGTVDAIRMVRLRIVVMVKAA